jgi:uncharacterized membrane protein YdbT with pleckstrin-like domain
METVMSYVETVQVDGEVILATGRTHWFIYAMPGFWFLLSSVACIAFTPHWIGGVGMAVSGIYLLGGWIYATSTELAVTSHRVIAKFGLIARHTVEVKNEKVESLLVTQSIPGRILNYGSISITGSGGTSAPIPFISNPLTFRSAAMTGQKSK